jgi:hypothetical protein
LSGLSLNISANSATAGTQVITLSDAAGSSTLTITWGAAPVVSAQFSQIGSWAALAGGVSVGATESIAAAPTTRLTTTTGLSANSSATGGAILYFYALPVKSDGTSLASSEKLSVSVSGPGTLYIGSSYGSSSAQGKSVTGAAGDKFIWLQADGTTGTSTITITDGTLTLGTVTALWTGSASKVTATQNLKVLKAGGTAGTANTAGQQNSNAFWIWTAYWLI